MTFETPRARLTRALKTVSGKQHFVLETCRDCGYERNLQAIDDDVYYDAGCHCKTEPKLKLETNEQWYKVFGGHPDGMSRIGRSLAWGDKILVPVVTTDVKA